MIEGINATVANAAVIRPQDGGSNPSAQNVKTGASSDGIASTPKAPYISPHIEVDVNYDKAVLQIRDSSTGDVVRQFPSESRLQELRREADEAQKPALPSAAADGPQQTQSQSVADSVQSESTPSSDSEALVQAQSAAAALSSADAGAGSATLSSSGVSFLA